MSEVVNIARYRSEKRAQSFEACLSEVEELHADFDDGVEEQLEASLRARGLDVPPVHQIRSQEGQ